LIVEIGFLEFYRSLIGLLRAIMEGDIVDVDLGVLILSFPSVIIPPTVTVMIINVRDEDLAAVWAWLIG